MLSYINLKRLRNMSYVVTFNNTEQLKIKMVNSSPSLHV